MRVACRERVRDTFTCKNYLTSGNAVANEVELAGRLLALSDRGRVDALGCGRTEQDAVGLAVAGAGIEVRLSAQNWYSGGVEAVWLVANAFATLRSV